jgi:two-component system, NtrC family, sensor histidine kinase GlrK
MRLLTRLLISHSIPVLVLTLALSVALAALLRIGVVLSTLREKELAVLHDEGQLHAIVWSLHREIRRATHLCTNAEEALEIVPHLSARIRDVKTELARTAQHSPQLREVVTAFAQTAAEAMRADPCAVLLSRANQERRTELDERLTDFWVMRLAVLHRAVEDKEGEAQSLAIAATSGGIPLALLAFVFAMWTARKLSRVLEEPLTRLAENARLVGGGDFSTPVHVNGPPEILALADALESMRTQLFELEALKQGFLASVSHELRTPLSKIREALALLEDGAVGALDERKARVVRIARAACEREIRMVTTLLDLSRLRAGSPLRLLERQSVDGALRAAVEDEQVEAEQRGVEIELSAPGTCGTARIDPELLERAIANVVRNAVSVSPRGDCVLVARSLEPPSSAYPRGVIRITVTDHGPGIPVEIRPRVFDPFVTHQVPKAQRAVGVGLGLPLAREVARAHGGELELVGTTEHGTTFQFLLPAEGKEQGTPESGAV